MVYWQQNEKEVLHMYTIRTKHDHVEVYNYLGDFLFSADTAQEERAILSEEYHA